MTRAMESLRLVPAPPGELYECPRWIADAGVFQWVDILAKTIFRWRPGDVDVESRLLDLPVVPAALPLDADRMIVASKDELFRYHWASGRLDALTSIDIGYAARFNDGTVAPDGSVWIGTMTEGSERHGALFQVDAEGSTRVRLEGVGISNGIVWTSSRHGYYIDSHDLVLWTLDLDPETDELTRHALLDLPGPGEPDGITVDAGGDVWIAMWDGSCLLRVDVGRRSVTRLEVPAHRPSAVVLGGAGGSTALVTTARSETGAGQAGSVFAVDLTASAPLLTIERKR